MKAIRFILFSLFFFPMMLNAQDGVLGIYKSRQKEVFPINEVYAEIINNLDTAVCKNLASNVAILKAKGLDNSFIKKKIRSAKNRKFVVEKKMKSNGVSYVSSVFYRVINPEKRGEELNYLNVVTAISRNGEKCHHLYSFVLENGVWKLTGVRELSERIAE